MINLLCVGDSITDCNRLFDNFPLGNGYVEKLTKYLLRNGYEISVKNMGNDGFTISRIYNQANAYIAEAPDILTILAGINDIALMMNTDRTPSQQTSMMNEFVEKYRQLLSELQPQIKKIIIMEPFIFPYPNEFRNWIPLIKKMNRELRELASEFHCPYISLHDLLNHEASCYGYTQITTDGVHLTSMGHEILTECLLKELIPLLHTL